MLVCFILQISAVRAVVPNKSNNEIVLVLQHFENCVDKAVQAFLEGECDCCVMPVHPDTGRAAYFKDSRS